MERLSESLPRGRGRPAADMGAHVVDDLLAATENALAYKTAKEITVREISTAAGTSEAMIRYYFGNKEGLLLAVIKAYMDASPHRDAARVTRACLSARSIRPLVEELGKFHYSRPNLIKMMAVELLSSSSELKEEYLRRYGHCIESFVQNAVDALREANIYRADVNAPFLAMSIVRLIVAPIMESAVTGTPERPPEVENGQWQGFIADMIDSISR